jgi:hypothetical protein
MGRLYNFLVIAIFTMSNIHLEENKCTNNDESWE